MAMNKSKDGRVNTENISGAKVPRKSGVSDERLGKSLGTRDIRAVGGQRFNYVNPKGRK